MTNIIIFGVILLIAIIIAFIAISVYNKLISLKAKVKEGASDIDVQLKRRYDLIPNLVSTVKGASAFEAETLEKVIKARQQAIDISGLSPEKAQAENMLSGALRQLFALSESYPELKANQNYLKLQDQLVETEDRILASRRFYNQIVAEYNTYQDQFPNMLFKGLAKAQNEPFFEMEDKTQRENPQVQF